MRLILLLLLSLWSGLAVAADTTIEMLNKLDNEYMVFSKNIVYIDQEILFFGKQQIKVIMLNLLKELFLLVLKLLNLSLTWTLNINLAFRVFMLIGVHLIRPWE